MDHHFNLNFDSSPIGGGLLDVFTYFLGWHTEGTALGSEGGGTGNFTSNDFEVNYFTVKILGESYRISFLDRLAWEACLLGCY